MLDEMRRCLCEKGTCIAGVYGNGTCECFDGYSGLICNVRASGLNAEFKPEQLYYLILVAFAVAGFYGLSWMHYWVSNSYGHALSFWWWVKVFHPYPQGIAVQHSLIPLLCFALYDFASDIAFVVTFAQKDIDHKEVILSLACLSICGTVVFNVFIALFMLRRLDQHTTQLHPLVKRGILLASAVQAELLFLLNSSLFNMSIFQQQWPSEINFTANRWLTIPATVTEDLIQVPLLLWVLRLEVDAGKATVITVFSTIGSVLALSIRILSLLYAWSRRTPKQATLSRGERNAIQEFVLTKMDAFGGADNIQQVCFERPSESMGWGFVLKPAEYREKECYGALIDVVEPASVAASFAEHSSWYGARLLFINGIHVEPCLFDVVETILNRSGERCDIVLRLSESMKE